MTIALTIGIALIILAIAVLIISFVKTPDHLRGYYGKMFVSLFALVLIAGATLITLSLIGFLG